MHSFTKTMWLLCTFSTLSGAYALQVPKSFSANFTHTATGGSETIHYDGTLLVNRSRAFIASIVHPTRQMICNYNSDLKWIDFGNKQAVKYDVGSLLDIMQILKVAEHYKGHLYKSQYHGYHFLLTTDAHGHVAQITYKDKQKRQNIIHLSAVRYYASPQPAKRFQCAIPDGFWVSRKKI